MTEKPGDHDMSGDNKPAPRLKEIEDRFDIVKILGKGTVGIVYHVIDRQRDNRECALKILTDIFALDQATLQRFHDEIKICCRINHRNIVAAYELVEFEDCIGYTMEIVNGCDLNQILHAGRLSYPEIDNIMYQLLDGLAALHDIKIMHRDIKLENIILRSDGIVKLSDLGLVKKLEAKRVTQPGILLGTPQYMPPEYIKSAWFDMRSDIYACGMVLYELLSGTRRLGDKQGLNAIQHLLSTKFQVPKLKFTKEHERYNDILDIALALSPDSRFQTAREMQAAFCPTNIEAHKVEFISNSQKSGLIGWFKTLLKGS